jgi:predicted transcriptional regulator
MKEDMHQIMENVRIALEDAKEYGLEVEVITWALKYLKEDPTISIDQAISYGYYEWIK